jgi:hypothetical protein
MLSDIALKFRKPFRWRRCKPRAHANIGHKFAAQLGRGVGPRKRIKKGNLVWIAGHLTPGFILTLLRPPLNGECGWLLKCNRPVVKEWGTRLCSENHAWGPRTRRLGELGPGEPATPYGVPPQGYISADRLCKIAHN